MFRALFGGDSGPSSGEQDRRAAANNEFSAEIEGYLDVILNPNVDASERRGAAYTLRELFTQDKRDLSIAYAASVSKNLKAFEEAVKDSENEEVAQTLLEILATSSERASSKLLKNADVMNMLMDVAKASAFVWVRVSAIQCLQALTVASPNQTVEHLLSIPSALETLVGFLSEGEVDVRNEMIVLLHKLTESSAQVGMFLTFCDGLNALLRIAKDEKDTIVCADCLAVCVNTLRSNPVAQKQFTETTAFLAEVSALIKFDEEAADPTPAMLRVGKCIEIVRTLCQGRLESKSSVAKELITMPRDEKRLVNLKDAQTKLGSSSDLIRNIFTAAADISGTLEDNTRREAICALGDLVCRHSRNGALLEKFAGFSFVASTALSSARWTDAKSAAYAWMCSLDGPEGEQRAIALLGHAVAPPPDVYEEDSDVKTDNAASLVASAVYHSVKSILVLREEVYVDPARVSERRIAMWRAIRLWELLLVSSSAKELALKVLVDDQALFDSICSLIKDLVQEKDETDAVKELVSDTCGMLMRLLIVWVGNDRESSNHLLSSASNLFLFEPLQSSNDLLQRLNALLIAATLVSSWNSKEQSVAFGLIENKRGISTFLKQLSRSKEMVSQVLRKEKEAVPEWSNDECTRSLFGLEFAQMSEKMMSQTDLLLIKGSSSSTQRPIESTLALQGANVNGSDIGALSESYSNSSELHLRFRRLEQDYAQLLLVLAHQEVERQSLLQTIQDLGGQPALDAALKRSATLLAKAFEHLDGQEELKLT